MDEWKEIDFFCKNKLFTPRRARILWKQFVITFNIRKKKKRKLKVVINMDNDWMYCVYRNSGQGFITLRVMSLGRFSKN